MKPKRVDAKRPAKAIPVLRKSTLIFPGPFGNLEFKGTVSTEAFAWVSQIVNSGLKYGELEANYRDMANRLHEAIKTETEGEIAVRDMESIKSVVNLVSRWLNGE